MRLKPATLRPRPTPQPELDVAARFSQQAAPKRRPSLRPLPVPQPVDEQHAEAEARQQVVEAAGRKHEASLNAAARQAQSANLKHAANLEQAAPSRPRGIRLLQRLSWKRVVEATGLARLSA